jgi:hypothetical protein
MSHARGSGKPRPCGPSRLEDMFLDLGSLVSGKGRHDVGCLIIQGDVEFAISTVVMRQSF